MLNAYGQELDEHDDIMLGADLLHAKAIQIASNKYQIYMPNPTKEGWVQSKSCAALGNEEDHVPIYVKDNGGKEPVFGVCKDGVITFDRSNGCGDETTTGKQSAYIVFKGNTETVGSPTTNINTNRCIYPSDFQGKCAYDQWSTTKHFTDAPYPKSCTFECLCKASHNTCADGHKPSTTTLDSSLPLQGINCVFTDDLGHTFTKHHDNYYCEEGHCQGLESGQAKAPQTAEQKCAALCSLQACSCE